MRGVLTLALLISASANIFSQGKKFEAKAMSRSAEWHEGSIQFSDQTNLKGLVQYNDLNGVLSFKTEGASEAFGPNTVSSFEFFDNEANKKRLFISIPYPRPRDNGAVSYNSWKTEFEDNKAKHIMVNTFVEILCESKTFALLSKVSPVRVKERSTGIAASANGAGGALKIKSYNVSQNEILFFLTHEGDLQPYTETVQTDHSLWGNTTSKKRKANSDLLEELTGEYFTQLIDYAKANKLRKNSKEDLVKLIEYYNSLVSKK